MIEEWKAVQGYEGEYIVSNTGKVKSFKRTNPCLLKPDLNGVGYARVTLSKDSETKRLFVHRLVALHFIGEQPEGKDMINHKDGNKLNNHVSNLEWASCSENTIHAFDNELRATGERSTNAQITDEVVHEVCKLIERGKVRGEILSLNLHDRLTKTKFDDIRSRRCWKRISCLYKW